MGYYMRFLVTDSRKLDLPTIISGLAKKKDRKYRINPSGTDAGELYLGNELLGELEINRRGTDLADSELAELEEELEAVDGAAAARKVLKKARTIVALRVLWQGREVEPTMEMLDPVWDWFFETRDGLLQADGEGYYDADGLIIEIE